MCRFWAVVGSAVVGKCTRGWAAKSGTNSIADLCVGSADSVRVSGSNFVQRDWKVALEKLSVL